MEYICLLLLLVINTVVCYYFYNPRTHELLIRPSLSDVPTGYKLLPPPRNHTRRKSRLTRGYCGDGGFTCNAPYDRSQTFQFECSNDDHCPSNYKCCPQKCFLHKICIKTTYPTTPSKIIDNPSCNEHQGQCDVWPYNCKTPYDYSTTYRFKCDRDSQCPKNFKCCQQSCFLHKICSRVVTKPPEKIVPAVRFVTKHINAVPTEEAVKETTTVEEESSTTEEPTETTPTTTEAATTTEEVEVVDTTEGFETTPENVDTEEATATEVEPTTEEVTEEVATEETNEFPEAELRLASIKNTMRDVTVAPTSTTLDSNAIDPNYVDNFYDSINTTEEYEDYYDEEGNEDDIDS